MADEIKTLEGLKSAVAEAGVEMASETVTAREPKRDALGRSYATGKRKNAVARVWIKPGYGQVTVNGQSRALFFCASFRSLA
ncbi:30S ribosomal protein S9 [Thioclava sp. BHET1]|nr:30S ribosomal protein S9 [Thioclava sp. BHET1]